VSEFLRRLKETAPSEKSRFTEADERALEKVLAGSGTTIYGSERAGGSQSSMRMPSGSLIHAKRP
jgi:hypothetical protein